jgi:putative hemolysin
MNPRIRPWITVGALRPARILFCTALLISGCAAFTGPESRPPTGSQASRPVGLPNPATVACSRAGGVPITERGPDGAERGLCRWPSGMVCDQWAFFRGECGTGQVDRRSGS